MGQSSFRLLAVCAYVCIALVGMPAYAQSIFEVGPYLSQVSSTSAEVRVETADLQQLSLDVQPGGAKTADKSPSRGMHSLKLTGLSPKTTYHYTVKSQSGATLDGSLTTAPADDDTGNVRFILFGDDRGGAAIHQAVVQRILDEPADFLVNTGDLVADGRVPAQWENFFEIEGALLKSRCLFPTIGNHDLEEESGASFLRYFGTPEERQTHVFNSTFRWGFIRFFMLNGEEAFTGDDRTWLERELSKADAEPGIAWRVAVVHDGPFASGLHGDNDRLLSASLPKLLREHHVDFVLEGHDHIYERGLSDGLRYVVSGGAGAPLYPIKHLRSTARKVESVYHYVIFEFAPEKGKLMAKRLDGSFIEQVGFSKTSFWDDDLPTAPGIAAPPADGGLDEAKAPVEERKESSYEVPYAAAGVLVVGGLWFWIIRRRKRTER